MKYSIWKEATLDLLFPPRCVGCDEVLSEENRKSGFCNKCKENIHPVVEPLCRKCGKQILIEEAEYCRDCLRLPHHYNQGRGVFSYEGPMKDGMYRLKYGNRREYAKTIIRVALEQHEDWLRHMRPEVIVPVPVHPKKLRKRGYNQAEVLARELSNKTGIPVEPLVERRVDTLPLKELTPEKRRKNLKNAFNIRKNGVKFKKVLIIDDIYTTGATVDAIAKLLLDSGAEEVYCLYGCIGRGY
ncbi:MAG: ComF family protein [Lachnospiraceae bacterium]|nr:ComF family protein [Lachnospiraceae bacterium]